MTLVAHHARSQEVEDPRYVIIPPQMLAEASFALPPRFALASHCADGLHF